jgi:hypothetical protein
VVLNKDYFTVPVEEIAVTYPYMTVMGGKIRFLHSEYASVIGKEPVGIELTYNNSPRYQ